MTQFNREDYLTTGQVARLLGVASQTVRRWCDTGIAECLVTAGGQRLIHKDHAQKLQPRPAGSGTES